MTSDQEHKLRMMVAVLEAFENGQLALDSLIPELEGLFNAVDLEDQDWREGFWNLWGDLEISYALALDMGWKSLDDARGKIVARPSPG